MKIKEQLKSISNYLDMTRRIGHTTTMLRGAQNVDKCIVVAQNSMHAKQLQKQIKDSLVIPMTSLDNSLRGMNCPLLIDNAALWFICEEAFNKIEELEKIIDDEK